MLLLALAMVAPAVAKRLPAPKVDPVVHQNIRYEVPNDSGRLAHVEVWDVKKNVKLWDVRVFRNQISRELEEDVQWVFVKSLRLYKGRLIVTAEDGRCYSLDPRTNAVEKLAREPKGP